MTFKIFQRQGGRWVNVLTRRVTTNSAGRAILIVTLSGPGSFYVRSQANLTPYNANSVNSPVERYDVG